MLPPTPMYWRRDFPGTAEQARAVRTFAAHLLADHATLDDVLLVLNELVVNAIRHTKSGQNGGRFTVEILDGEDGVAVSVADQGGPDEPAATAATELDESGRGLHTVSLTATSWGWHGNEGGRSVTAVFT